MRCCDAGPDRSSRRLVLERTGHRRRVSAGRRRTRRCSPSPRRERGRVPHPVALDIGCGAARNTVPLAAAGLGCHRPRSLVGDAASRASNARSRRPCRAARNSRLPRWTRCPLRHASVDLVIAHGIWNLARTAAEFRGGIREAARVARPGAVALRLHVFAEHPAAGRCRRCQGSRSSSRSSRASRSAS